ncbi:MAG: TnpV protein [Oscillospiraceae bacterium]|nr:TnpV protein [Oscillospiraceae bacterium]
MNVLTKTLTETLPNGTELEYRLDENTGTYFPILETQETPTPTFGKYGQLRATYLKQHKPTLYMILQIKGTLNSHLQEIDRTANSRLEQLMPELMKQAAVTENLKAENPMEWVGLMNNLKRLAEEIIYKELIHT